MPLGVSTVVSLGPMRPQIRSVTFVRPRRSGTRFQPSPWQSARFRWSPRCPSQAQRTCRCWASGPPHEAASASPGSHLPPSTETRRTGFTGARQNASATPASVALALIAKLCPCPAGFRNPRTFFPRPCHTQPLPAMPFAPFPARADGHSRAMCPQPLQLRHWSGVRHSLSKGCLQLASPASPRRHGMFNRCLTTLG